MAEEQRWRWWNAGGVELLLGLLVNDRLVRGVRCLCYLGMRLQFGIRFIEPVERVRVIDVNASLFVRFFTMSDCGDFLCCRDLFREDVLFKILLDQPFLDQIFFDKRSALPEFAGGGRVDPERGRGFGRLVLRLSLRSFGLGNGGDRINRSRNLGGEGRRRLVQYLVRGDLVEMGSLGYFGLLLRSGNNADALCISNDCWLLG